MSGRGSSLAALAVVALGLAVSAGGAAPPEPTVTLIADSIGTGMYWHPEAVAALNENLAVDWEVAVCRRLTTPSCPFEGQQAPNLLDVVKTLGSRLGDTVIVEMGYNEPEATFAQSVEESIAALRRGGAKHILWPTLHATRHPYVRMNATLAAAARRHREVTLVDWNTYARSHPDWFQSDGEHLDETGGLAMAKFLHLAVMKVVDPLRIDPRPLRAARVGREYGAQLEATGGRPPYTWRLVGRPPSGLHLRPDGWIFGVPWRSTVKTVAVTASDAEGQTATRAEVLTVTR